MGERAFQAERIAKTKALKQENTRLVWEIARRPLWLEQHEEGFPKLEDAV